MTSRPMATEPPGWTRLGRRSTMASQAPMRAAAAAATSTTLDPTMCSAIPDAPIYYLAESSTHRSVRQRIEGGHSSPSRDDDAGVSGVGAHMVGTGDGHGDDGSDTDAAGGGGVHMCRAVSYPGSSMTCGLCG